jgi:hypothetical protein
MTQQAPAQPFQYASDFLAEDTPPPQSAPPAPPGTLSVDQRLFALEKGQVAILEELKALKPVVKKLRLESHVLKVIKSTAFLTLVTAAGNVAMAQLPGAKQWVPAIVEMVRVTQ